jgi:hypothetical protein
MRGRTRAIARTAAALAAALACAAGAFAQRVTSGTQGVFKYEYETAPERLVKGDTVLFILRIEGLSATSLKVDSLVLSSGVDLDTQAIRPYVRKGATRGSELRLGFYLREAGEQSIDALSLSSTEGWIDLGPIKLNIEDSSGTGAWRTVIWSWKAPTSAYRYEAFAASLGRADEGNIGKDMAASFTAPADSTIEGSGYLRWTVVALKDGKLVLPDASIVPSGGAPGPRGEADAVTVTIKPIPKAISESKAIGRFTLKLDGPVPAKPIAGETAEFKLRLEGKGNFPSLVLPAPELRLDGAELGGGDWSSKRENAFGPSESGYSGSATLLVDVVPPRAGRLRLRFPSMAVLGPDGRISTLEASAIEVEVRAPDRPSASEPARVGQPESAPSAAPAASAAKPAKAAPAPRATKPTKAAPAAAAQPDAQPAAQDAAAATPEAAEPSATPETAEGEAGARLASLYGSMRRSLSFERSYREADEAALALLASLGLSRGEGEPMLDALPPPKAFLAIALAFLAAAILVAALAARRRGRDAPRRRPPAAAIVLAAIVVVAVVLAGVAEVERFSSFAVAWTDSVRLIPSPNARMEIGVSRGSTARLRGESSGFSGLVFADGVEAWTPSESVFKY